MAVLGDTKAVSLTLLDGVIGNLNPKTTNVYTLGTSSLKWNNIYATTITGDVTGNCSGSSGSCTGNASTATRINGNVTTCSDANNHNIWFSSDSSGSGIPNIAAGVYITPSTKTITATTFAGSLSGTATLSNALATDPTALTNANIAHVTKGGVIFRQGGSTVSNSPRTYGNYLHFHWLSSNNWDTQLYLPEVHSSSIFWRSHSDTSTWGSWKTILDSSNYSSYTDYSTQLFVRHSSWVKGTQIASDASLTINFVEKGTGTAEANKLGMIKSYASGGTKNTRIGLWAYKNEPSDTGADYFLLAYEWDGTTAVKRTYTDAKVYGAVWNDYAEFRKTNEKVKPGQVVVDNDDGSLNIAYARLLPGAQVVSDTFGFAIGETEKTKTPLAVSGRVLVYTYQDRNKYHAGQAVCSAPNGTVDIMTRREIEAYPDAIIGIVSEIPDYEEWGQDNIKVDNRIWIKVR